MSLLNAEYNEELRTLRNSEFIAKFLVDKLIFTPIDETITVHATCSTIKMDFGCDSFTVGKIVFQQRGCSLKKSVVAALIAGDKGFTHPEVNKFALRKLRPQIEKHGITSGYSNSRTCEIGLNTNSGISFMNIVYLVDRVTTAK